MIDQRWQAVERVLVVRLDNLGDVLVTTPAIHAIQRSLPNTRITLLASPVGAQAGRLNPDIDDVIVYQAPWMDPWCQLPQDATRELDAIASLGEGRFDGAIIFTSFRQSALPSAYLCYLAGIPLRVAASIDGPGSLLTTRHRHPERMMHEVERGLDLVGSLGLTTDESDLILRVPSDAQERVRQRWIDPDISGRSELDPLVVVHPGCSMLARTYPWEMYVDVIDLLVQRLHASVMITGASGERQMVDQIYDKLRPITKAATRRTAGELEFAELCALIEVASLIVTNNTGPMHIAAAVKTPVVALFALTNPPEQWGPWRVPHRLLNHDVPCRLCYSRICPVGHECLRLVTPDTVVHAAMALLDAGCHDSSSPMLGVQSPAFIDRSREAEPGSLVAS